MTRPNELVLLRHGESTWNLQNRFSGWTDVPLTVSGEEEATSAGLLMAEEGLAFDVVHTSLLRRAINTANLALDRMDLHWLPVSRSWRLNERHYGGLQGLNKKETAAMHGAEQVFQWPGTGLLAIEAVRNRDFPVLQAVIIVFAGIFVVCNLIVDILYAYLDPRIRYST